MREAVSIRFWGTRGSLPRPGADFLRYGGNTTCVEIRLGGHSILLDAGSGVQAAGAYLLEHGLRTLDIVLSHLHHDHVIGLPFVPQALEADCTIRTYCGNLGGSSAAAALDQMFAPPLFPITLGTMPCRWEHMGFHAGDVLTLANGITARTCKLVHPGGATAYRFDYAGQSLCYVSDVEHQPGAPDPDLVALCAGADLVIYDTMFTDSEFQACRGWGHSTLGAGVLLCQTAGAKRLAATHHHIRHTDTMLDKLDGELRRLMPESFLAREGQVVTLGAEPTRRTSSVSLKPERVE